MPRLWTQFRIFVNRHANAMTLKEHLYRIGKALAAKGADNKSILYFQLYLLCLGWDGFLCPDDIREGLSESKRSEPYKTLEEYTPLGWLWDAACNQGSAKGKSVIDEFFDDGILWVATKDSYREAIDEMLNVAEQEGGRGTIRFQPKEITELVCRLSGYQKGMTVYNPFASVGTYSVHLAAGDKFYGDEKNSIVWGIGVLINHIYGTLSKNYILWDSLHRDWSNYFDIVVSSPPLDVHSQEEDTYLSRLVKDIPELLNPRGTMVLVTVGGFFFGSKGRSIAQSGKLDMVVTLPGNVYYWSGVRPVIVRLKEARFKGQPVRMVDGSSFFATSSGRVKTILVNDLMKVIESRDPKYVADVSIKDLETNNFNLNPACYLDIEEEDSKGRKLVCLRELGKIIKPSTPKDQPRFFIRNDNLSDNPLKLDIPISERKEDYHARFGFLRQSALLIGGNPSRPRFGLFKFDESSPVGIASSICGFIPDENQISTEYVAVTLAENGLFSGSSILRITTEDLALTRIPMVPKSEQLRVIKEYAQKHSQQTTVLPRLKVKVALVGNPSVPVQYEDDLEIRGSFLNARETRNWVRNKANRKTIDAVIINQTDNISFQDIFSLCNEEIPTFILTQDLQGLEDQFGSYAEQYLPGRGFSAGSETELFSVLFQFVNDQNTPEGRISILYSEQLAAAEDLDAKFCYENYCLHDKLMEILLSQGDGPDCLTDLRKIRDNCILQPLIDYGYLPKTNKRSFTIGAEVDLLANRVYSTQDASYILLKSLFPKNLASLLQASGPVLNLGPHALSQADKNIRLVVLQVIMACICHMSDLIKQGKFNSLDPARISGQYIGNLSTYSFESGRYLVQALSDEPSYLFAGNTHLDQKECAKQGVCPGDFVEIETMPIPEKQPRVTDFERVFFYSKIFKKIVE